MSSLGAFSTYQAVQAGQITFGWFRCALHLSQLQFAP